MRPVRLRHRGELREVHLEKDRAAIGDRAVAFARQDRDGRLDGVVVGDRAHRVLVAREGDRVFVWCDGSAFSFEQVRGGRAAAGAEHSGDLLAPMPGRVRRIFCAAGERVERGQLLVALEAMKMEHSIRAPKDGTVRKILVREGDLVDAGAELVEIADS